MKSIESGSLVALGATAVFLFAPAAGATSAPAEVTIEISVAEIAVLTVANATGTVVVDSTNRAGFTIPTDPAALAELTLQTNFCIDSLEVEFPRVTGLRGGFPARWYGAATGIATTNTLGVTPYLITPQAFVFYGGSGNAFGLPADPVQGALQDTGLSTSGASAGLCSPANGMFDLSLGVVTKWDLTLPPQPVFAAPDTYTIPLTVSIVP